MNQQAFKKYLQPLLAILLVVVLVWGGFMGYRATTFHVVKTNPSTGNVATETPFLDIYFNHTLSANSAVVSSAQSIIQSKSVSSKVLRLSLKLPLNSGQSYSITVDSISDISGHHLNNLHFNFKPESIAFNKLPTDQQNATLKSQASAAKNAPHTASDINFQGTGELTAEGISSSQLYYLEQEFFDFDKSAGTIVISDAQSGPLNGSGTFTINFGVTIDATPYSATITYSGLNTVELTLVNAQGTQVFSGGDPSS